MSHVLFAQVAPSFWEKALDQVPALTVVCVGGLVIVVMFLRTIREFVRRFTDREDRIIGVIDRNTEAFSAVEVLTYEVRELRREESERHRDRLAVERDNVHAMRALASAAGLKKEWEEIQQTQAHRARGGPPGTIVVETPPVTLGPAGEGGGGT